MSCYSTKSIILDSIKITYSLSKIIVSYVINLFKINISVDSIKELSIMRKDGVSITPSLVCFVEKSNMVVSCKTMGISCSVICGIGINENYYLVKEGIFKVTPEGIYYIT